MGPDPSFGAANYGARSDYTELMRRGDLAMYKDKRAKGLRYTRIAV